MKDLRQLSYMLRLLEDDSPSVHEAVHGAFVSWGPTLREDLRHLSLPEQALAEERLGAIIRENDRVWLRQQWLSANITTNISHDLEWYLCQLSEFLDDRSETGLLTKRLDALACSFLQTAGPHDSGSLASHLFGPYGIRGATGERYHRVENSNVRQVIDEKEGIPISLTSVYILVANRIGYCVRGCNFPGHFLAIAELHERKVIVDCYNGGKILGSDDTQELGDALPESAQEIGSMECPEHVMLQRYLRNLTNSYHRLGDVANERFFDQLLIDFAGRIPSA